jgi:hypothetical protein
MSAGDQRRGLRDFARRTAGAQSAALAYRAATGRELGGGAEGGSEEVVAAPDGDFIWVSASRAQRHTAVTGLCFSPPAALPARRRRRRLCTGLVHAREWAVPLLGAAVPGGASAALWQCFLCVAEPSTAALDRFAASNYMYMTDSCGVLCSVLCASLLGSTTQQRLATWSACNS